jgi:uncharacterized protein
MKRAAPFIEPALIFLGVILLLRLIMMLDFGASPFPYRRFLGAVVMIYIPLLYTRWRGLSKPTLKTDFKSCGCALLVFFLTSLIIFPFFFLGNHYWQALVVEKSFTWHVLPRWHYHLLEQLVLIGLAEELFFRGWLQNKLNDFFKKNQRFLGASVGLGWPVTALLFAAAHSMIAVEWWHVAIFFPGLLFGWLRERTNTIIAPALFHATCNMAMLWIGVCYS